MRPFEHLAAFMSRLPHFAALSPDELRTVARAMDIQRYSDAQEVIREGARANGIYLMMQGSLEVVRVRGEQEDLLNHVLEGELFGLVAMVDDSLRSATCRACGEVKIAKLPRRAFTRLFEANAAIAYAFARALTTQLARDFRTLHRQIRTELEHRK